MPRRSTFNGIIRRDQVRDQCEFFVRVRRWNCNYKKNGLRIFSGAFDGRPAFQA